MGTDDADVQPTGLDRFLKVGRVFDSTDPVVPEKQEQSQSETRFGTDRMPCLELTHFFDGPIWKPDVA